VAVEVAVLVVDVLWIKFNCLLKLKERGRKKQSISTYNLACNKKLQESKGQYVLQ